MNLWKTSLNSPVFYLLLHFQTVSKVNNKLPELPARLHTPAVAEFMSEKQINIHWDKHHRAYFNNLGNLLKDAPEDVKKMSLDQLVQEAVLKKNTPLFNNAAQALNHNFFWESINADGAFNAQKHPELAKKVEKDLGGILNVITSMSQQAKTHFGSGWAWLVLNKDGKLEVKSYHDADTPYAHGETPLLTIDVWEHAYYIDYQNRRPDFVDNYFKHLANWDFAEANLKSALKH